MKRILIVGALILGEALSILFNGAALNASMRGMGLHYNNPRKDCGTAFVLAALPPFIIAAPIFTGFYADGFSWSCSK